jgi:hypothetical protein
MGQTFPQGILNKTLRDVAEQLRSQLYSLGTIDPARFYPNHLQLTTDEFRGVAETIINSVDATLQRIKPNIKEVEEENEEEGVTKERYRYKSLTQFQNHCKLLLQEANQFSYLFSIILPASQHLRALASLIAYQLPRWGGRKRRVLAALGAILSRACLSKYAGEPAKVVATLQPWLTPEALLTAPFCGKRRRKKLQPLELVAAFATQTLPPIYVEEPDDLQNQLEQGKPALIFVLPKKQVEAAWESLQDAEVISPKLGTYRPVVPKELKKDPRFSDKYFKKCAYKEHLAGLPMEARLTKKMVTVLQQGALFSPPRVLSPRGPSRKITVNLIFHGPPAAFQSPPQFYGATYKRRKGLASANTVSARPLVLNKEKMISLDINRIATKDILAFAAGMANAKDIPVPVGCEAECVQVHLIRKRMTKFRKAPKSTAKGPTPTKQRQSQFGRVWKAIADAEARGTDPLKKLGRLKAERTLLYRRWSGLKRALDQEVSLVGARVVIAQGAGTLVVEELDLDPRGKTRGMGAIVTDMPKRAAITEAMKEKANQYHIAVNGWREGPVALERVSPYLTSKYCALCGRKLEGSGDVLKCPNPTCPNHAGVNRHTNAAQVILQRGRRKELKRAEAGIT